MKKITNIGNMTKIVGKAKACQFQIPPSWFATTSLRFNEPTSSNTLTITKPIDTSYDTICAAERRPPRNGYFEFDAQPPMMMP